MNFRRDNNFTKKQLQGITLTVKSLKKKFPFIVSWKLSKNYDLYAINLYIDLGIDLDKLSKYVGLEISPMYLNKNLVGREIGSLLLYLDWGASGSEEWEKTSKLSVKIGKNINDEIELIYDYIPEDSKVFFEYDTTFGTKRKLVNLVSSGYHIAK